MELKVPSEKKGKTYEEMYDEEKAAEIKAKISVAIRGKSIPRPDIRGDKNPAKRPEVRKKIAESKMGDKNPMKRLELRSRMMGDKNPMRRGFNNPMKNPEVREKHRKIMNLPEVIDKKRHFREENGRWLGGISLKPWPFEFDEPLKESIRERDDHICKIPGCGKTEEQNGRKLGVHHIDYNKENCHPSNLISLCCFCHGITNGNREYWQAILEEVNCVWSGT